MDFDNGVRDATHYLSMAFLMFGFWMISFIPVLLGTVMSSEHRSFGKPAEQGE